MNEWYKINNTKGLISPSLIVYPERIEKNIDLMIEIAGSADKLRPHIKTHKMGEIIKLQMRKGISKFKCATIAEAELLASCDARDILLAMQPTEIDMVRFFKLINSYPNSNFSTLVDNLHTVAKISNLAEKENTKVGLWVDINNGMNRTGIVPDHHAVELYQAIESDPNIIPNGLHVYDGHIQDSDIQARTENCEKDFATVLELKKILKDKGINISTIIAGGTPSFPIHKNRKNVEVSPGTTLLWDARYADRFKDLSFLPAAALFTRAVSQPNKAFTCFDLGHKSVASEMPLPRVKFLNQPAFQQISQSEEHLVINDDRNAFQVGDEAYVLPIHICPTVSKYNQVICVVSGEKIGNWKIDARDQQITI